MGAFFILTISGCFTFFASFVVEDIPFLIRVVSGFTIFHLCDQWAVLSVSALP